MAVTEALRRKSTAVTWSDRRREHRSASCAKVTGTSSKCGRPRIGARVSLSAGREEIVRLSNGNPPSIQAAEFAGDPTARIGSAVMLGVAGWLTQQALDSFTVGIGRGRDLGTKGIARPELASVSIHGRGGSRRGGRHRDGRAGAGPGPAVGRVGPERVHSAGRRTGRGGPAWSDAGHLDVRLRG